MAETVKSLKSFEQKIPSFDHHPSDSSIGEQIDNLRSEVAGLREILAEKTGIAYDKVAARASGAATYVQQEATSVAGTIREHPAASTTLFTLIGAIGFAVGYAVATASAESKQQAWYQRYLGDRFS